MQLKLDVVRVPTALPQKLEEVAEVQGASEDCAAAADAAPALDVRRIDNHAQARADSFPCDAGHADSLQHGFRLRRVPALPGRDHDRHGLLTLFDGQVQLGGEPAARASQSVISGLGEDTARWLPL
ncbi:hypothetical protein ACFWIB_39895 [Streptomyces sp. NPDC127051]|uniref:hypothetical protein n=1 Tax=Streptomyces sp. NPDC127051 TaxID=3347119 RepID=UPI0036595B7D